MHLKNLLINGGLKAGQPTKQRRTGLFKTNKKTRKGHVMTAAIERKIQKQIEEDAEAESDGLPNQCLGKGCKIRLPKGLHFCKKCRPKNGHHGRRPSTPDISHRRGSLLSG